MLRPDARDLLEEAVGYGHAPPLEARPGILNHLVSRVSVSAGSVLVVASDRVVRDVPAVRAMISAGAIHDARTHPNPTVDDVIALSAVIADARPRSIVAVGGGSTLDLAKSARLVMPDRASLDAALRGDVRAIQVHPPTLVAVPTTAGTGAEVTPFATLYRDRRKVSLDTPAIRPDRAVLDGALLVGCPPEHGVPAVLDALCHAVESDWSTAATPRSRRYAAAARDALTASLLAPKTSDQDSTQELLVAAALAGAAIAVTRTTAAHAFSYHLTAEYGIPHGFACAMSMSWIETHLAARGPDLRSRRTKVAVAALRAVLSSALENGIVDSPRLSGERLNAYINAGLSTQARMAGHPVAIDQESARRFIQQDGVLTGDITEAVSSRIALDTRLS